jgi:hypothetical protein
MRFKPIFRYSTDERLYRLFRVIWNTDEYSVKLTFAIGVKPWMWFIGGYEQKPREFHSYIYWLGLIPCLPLRIHYMRSFGGVFV